MLIESSVTEVVCESRLSIRYTEEKSTESVLLRTFPTVNKQKTAERVSIEGTRSVLIKHVTKLLQLMSSNVFV